MNINNVLFLPFLAMAYFLKIINVLFLSTIKYFYTPIYAHIIGLDFWTTLITMISGGIMGFLIYYHFSKIIIISTKHINPKLKKVLPKGFIEYYQKYNARRKIKHQNKKLFTRRARMMVKFGNNYGMITLIVLTPVLVSLILGAFLLRRYYSHRPEAVPLMILAIIIEGCLLVIGYWHITGATF
ncbi:MAG: hypothetical protein HOB13_07090 [Lentimicrobiaceae bacterium]|nr:hypothetical protein [Lentimicrobiaceae bacterium]MBT6672477.1 hypothetical protein [Lentimicrobiaceae bacterium]MBT6963392.1 hypothetical protein [Lentimicrobiaceae bacterium]